MSSIYASSFWRQAVFAARPLRSAQPAYNRAFLAHNNINRSRHASYSTQSEAKEQEDSSTTSPSEQKKDDGATPSSGEEECLKKLKAKEDEVVDLTVSPLSFFPMYSEIRLNENKNRVDYGISKPTS